MVPNHTRRACRTGLLVILGLCGRVDGQQYIDGFEDLGELPGGGVYAEARDASHDCRVVVGVSEPALLSEAFVWRDSVFEGLGDFPGGIRASRAEAVSGDGSIVFGEGYPDTNVPQSFRWTESTGMQPIYGLDGDRIFVRGTSHDGRVVVGSGGGSAISTDFGITFSSFSDDDVTPQAVSSDGTAVVGGGCILQGCGQILWNLDTGQAQLLYEGTANDPATALTDDLSVIAGVKSERATRNGVFIDSPEWRNSRPSDMTADGRIIVGAGDPQGIFGTPQAFIWTEELGMRNLRDALRDVFCYDVPEDWIFTNVAGISRDGSVLVASYEYPSGKRAVRISLPTASLVETDPRSRLIDARADFSSSGLTPRGIDRIELSFAVPVVDASTLGPLVASSFEVTTLAGEILDVLDVAALDENGFRFELYLVDPLPPGTWTTITPLVVDAASRLSAIPTCGPISIGFLPGDVNGDGTSGPTDIVALVDILNGISGDVDNLYRCDIDHSGACGPADITRLVDLLNGVNTSRAWLGQVLPVLRLPCESDSDLDSVCDASDLCPDTPIQLNIDDDGCPTCSLNDACEDGDECTDGVCEFDDVLGRSLCTQRPNPLCCGDSFCHPAETFCSCSTDCAPPAAVCGNGACEVGGGESCLTCPDDCAGQQDGDPRDRFCCGFGGQNPVGCLAGLCSANGYQCVDNPYAGCCGNGICEGEESSCNCPDDCERVLYESGDACSDDEDNDCDGFVDCNDADCADEPACG